MKDEFKKILLFCIFFFVAVFSIAQPIKNINTGDKYRAVNWGLNEGLSQAETYCMIKDQNGFLWIGTKNGLNRFDGYSFKIYFHDPQKKGTIADDFTTLGMIEDSLHNIWIGTRIGLSRYDIKADTFTNFSLGGESSPFWASKDKVYCWEPNNQVTTYDIHSFTRKKLVKLEDNDQVGNGTSMSYSFLDTRSNDIWMLSGKQGLPGGGLLQVSLKEGKKLHYEWSCFKNIPNHSHDAEAMCYDHKRNCLWINSSDGLMQFTLDNKQFHYVNALNNLLNAKNYDRWVGISLDPQNRVWLATKPKGIVIYDPSDESVTFPFAEDTIIQEEISDYNACIYCDRDGIVWSGFWERKGIYQLLPYSQVVKHYIGNPKQPHSLSSNIVYAIASAGHDKLWVGTLWGGLNIFDTQTGLFHVLHERDLPGIKMKTDVIPIMIDTISQKAWLVTDGGFFETDMRTKKSHPVMYRNQDNQIIPALNDAIPKSYKKEIIVTGSYGNQQGIFIVNTDSSIAHEVLSFPGNMFNPFFTIPAGDRLIFLKGQNDLVGNQTYINIGGKWIQKHTPIDSVEWSDIRYNEKDLTYWVAGERKLFHFDKDFHIIRKYTRENGLPEFAIESMIPDNKGNIWFNTDRSIHQLNIETGIIATLSEKDGFEKQDFTASTLAEKDGSGNIYFPGGKFGMGFNQVNPDKFISPSSSVYLRSLEINQSPFPLSTGVNNLQELSLRYNENNITIETGVIDFYSKGKSSIRYKLERINNDWHYAPANYTIRYDGLPPGNYKLVMQASNAGNEFNGPLKSMLIHISPPFWKTWWFISLIVIIILIAINALFQFRLNQKMQVLKVRQRLHRDLHDDVGATLSTVKVYSEILQKDSDNTLITELIKTNAADMIDKLEIIAWATNPQHDTFKSFKEVINKYASAICHAKNIELNLEYDGVNENMIMPGDVRQNLFLIFKEAINNIIKYSEASQCNVQIDIKHHKFSFKITDNGKGFRGITKGNGSGWKNMQKRCEEINGKVTIESKDGKGTIISISLPYPFKIPSFWDRKRSIV